MGARWRDERGQAMVLVALGVIVLLGALALAVEFGYGLTQRRVMQTASDSAALAVGRYLATNVVQTRGEMQFTVTEAGACEVARQYVEANDSFAPQGHTRTFTVAFAAAALTGEPILPVGAVPFVDPATGLPSPWEVVVRKTDDCAGAATMLVRPDVRYVHVFSEISYRSLVSGVLGFPTTTASASARAKVFGTPVPLGSPLWPMVRHYDKSDFNNQTRCAPGGCDPTDIVPTTFWSPSEDDMVYANGFKGMVDLSMNSPTYGAAHVPQLITAYDATGVPPDVKVDRSGNCPAGWDTRGGESPQNEDKQCSIPNWFYYAFGGTLSLTSDWVANTPPGQEAPSVLTTRSVCGADRPDPAPSCDAPTVGDWVEIATGNVGSNESGRMIDRIQREGFTNSMSSLPVDPNKPNGTKYGKALVVLIYLWDCAESYNSSAPAGQQWDLIEGPQHDCSAVSKNDKPARVHLFTVAPFTFYEGLVSSSSIQGFWGGVFGDVTACEVWIDGVPMCDLNPLANSAALVADDGYDGP